MSQVIGKSESWSHSIYIWLDMHGVETSKMVSTFLGLMHITSNHLKKKLIVKKYGVKLWII